jgi:hypothetical protein
MVRGICNPACVRSELVVAKEPGMMGAVECSATLITSTGNLTRNFTVRVAFSVQGVYPVNVVESSGVAAYPGFLASIFAHENVATTPFESLTPLAPAYTYIRDLDASRSRGGGGNVVEITRLITTQIFLSPPLTAADRGLQTASMFAADPAITLKSDGNGSLSFELAEHQNGT